MSIFRRWFGNPKQVKEPSGPQLDLGWSYYQNGDYQRAIQVLREAADKKINPGLAHYRLGFCFRAIDQHDEAIKHFRQAASLDPKDAWSAYQVGKEFALERLFRAALPEFARAIERNPIFVEAYHDAAACFGTLGHFETALACFTVCSFAAEIAAATGTTITVTSPMLETAMFQLAGILGQPKYDATRARVWRAFGMMHYPIPGDVVPRKGFEVMRDELTEAMRTHGADEQALRSLLGL